SARTGPETRSAVSARNGASLGEARESRSPAEEIRAGSTAKAGPGSAAKTAAGGRSQSQAASISFAAQRIGWRGPDLDAGSAADQSQAGNGPCLDQRCAEGLSRQERQISQGRWP